MGLLNRQPVYDTRVARRKPTYASVHRLQCKYSHMVHELQCRQSRMQVNTQKIYISSWFKGNASQVMPIYSVLATSILIFPFVCQHKECRHSDGEVPFGLIKIPTHNQSLDYNGVCVTHILIVSTRRNLWQLSNDKFNYYLPQLLGDRIYNKILR